MEIADELLLLRMGFIRGVAVTMFDIPQDPYQLSILGVIIGCFSVTQGRLLSDSALISAGIGQSILTQLTVGGTSTISSLSCDPSVSSRTEPDNFPGTNRTSLSTVSFAADAAL